MRNARVALYGAGGAPYHHAARLARAGHEVCFVFPEDIRHGALRGFDAFVMPGGGSLAMLGQVEPLGEDGATALREYVEGGGMYIGSCAGSYDAILPADDSLRASAAKRALCLLPVEAWTRGEEESASPGVGVIEVRNQAPEHPVMQGMPERFPMTHYNGPYFKEGEVLATVAARTERFTPSESFLGSHPGPYLIDRAVEEEAPAIIVGNLGDGRVVLFGPHPEFGDGSAMDGESIATRMLLNAVEWQIECVPGDRPAVKLATDAAGMDDTQQEQVARLLQLVRERVKALQRRDGEPLWMTPEYAIASFGLDPVSIWRDGLCEIDRLATQVEAGSGRLTPALLSFRPPASWETDMGFMGVLPLLETAVEMLGRAYDLWEVDLGPPPTDPWEHFESNPYHLAVGSYLSALGYLVGAKLLTECATGTTG